MTDQPCTDPRIARSRGAVIEATLQLLGERGFAGVSIDAISRASGVARTTIYRHWTSLAEIVHDAVRSVAPPPPPDNDSGDPIADVTEFLRGLAHNLTDAWGRIFPIIIDAADRDPELWELQTNHSAERRAVLEAIIARGQAGGAIGNDTDAAFLAELLTAPLFTRRFINHLPVDDAFVDRVVARVLGTPPPGTPRTTI